MHLAQDLPVRRCTAVGGERVMGSTQQQHYKCHVDFDEMLALAQQDPESFEEKRLEYIEAFLDKIPAEKQRRLRGLQWQVDQARLLARTPMASCIAISNMMWDSLNRLNHQQRELVKLTTGQAAARSGLKRPLATVLPFPAHPQQ